MAGRRGFGLEDEQRQRNGYQQICSGELFPDFEDVDVHDMQDTMWGMDAKEQNRNPNSYESELFSDYEGEETQDAAWGENAMCWNGYQQLDTGGLFSDSLEKKYKEESRESESRENPKSGKKHKKEKESLLVSVRDALQRECAFVRDEQRNLYHFNAGIYNKLDVFLLAEYIKGNLPDALVRQISDPGFYSKLLTDLKSDCGMKVVDRKKLDSRMKYLTAFRNGVYDCRRQIFLDFSPDYILFSKLEADYLEYAQTPVFDDFLEDVSGGDDTIKELIWEMIAYFLLPANDGKCFFVMGTAPNSWKSLLAKVIEAMFPDSAVNRAPISSISGRFGLASMADKRINIAPECVDERIALEVVNNIKLLTGEEAVNIERKGIDASREYLACKLLIATNCATAFAVKDSAFWNRMRIVPFLYSIPQRSQKTDLFDDLKRELDSIASIAVSQYTGRLIESNYQFTVPDASARLMCQWRNSSIDQLKEFLDYRCEVTYDLSDFIPVRELYDEYCLWLKQSYSHAEPLAIRDFGRKIRERFTKCAEPREKEKVGDAYVRVLHGICWLEDYDVG